MGSRTQAGDAEEAQARLEEEVSRVLLNALDSLSPAERAAFVLNDVFGMTPDTVADIVGRTQPEIAELADRARHSLREQRSHPTTPEEHDALARAVRQACLSEDTDLLASLLCPDATAFFDGGGKVRALTRPVHGSRQVAHSLLALLARRPRTTLATHSVNGRTGLVARYDHQVAAVISLDIADHHVAQVWVILNPDKLRSWNQPSTPGGPGSRHNPSQQGDGWF
jgi:RNA polymerase sigma-70 factor (ECF subfamily)